MIEDKLLSEMMFLLFLNYVVSTKMSFTNSGQFADFVQSKNVVLAGVLDLLVTIEEKLPNERMLLLLLDYVMSTKMSFVNPGKCADFMWSKNVVSPSECRMMFWICMKWLNKNYEMSGSFCYLLIP